MFHRHVVFIIASSIGLIASPMFAQSSNDSCAACDNTPNIIQSYYQFVTKATAIMGDDYKESAVSPGAPFVGQFLSRNLTLSNSNTLATIFRNQQTRLNENLTFLANTARVTGKTALGTLDNRTRSMASWFNIALKRDIDKIASLDSQIDNVTLALGRAGLTDRNLASDTRNELVQLIGGLSPTIFDKTSQIPIDTTYGNIITIINHMQAQIKDGLINTNNPQAVKKQFSAGGAKINFSEQFIGTGANSVYGSYTCVREQMCNDNIQQTIDSFGDARQQSIGESKDAINQFISGGKKLKKFFTRKVGTLNTAEEKALQAHMDELNRMLNGYRGNSGTIKIWNPHFRSNLKDIIADIDQYRSNEQELAAQKTDNSYIPPISALEEQMTQGINTINMIITKDSIVLNAQFASDQTETIAESVAVLHTTITTLKECEKNLSITCMLQCGNKGGVCTAD